MTNMSSIEHVAALLQAIGQESRLQILLAIGEGETCVCHLEAMLGLRQATLSQHLMALREAGLLSTRREGKYIFYRLERPEIMEMVKLAAHLADFDMSIIVERANHVRSSCNCPTCSTEVINPETA